MRDDPDEPPLRRLLINRIGDNSDEVRAARSHSDSASRVATDQPGVAAAV
jgi:hypothetical protein